MDNKVIIIFRVNKITMSKTIMVEILSPTNISINSNRYHMPL